MQNNTSGVSRRQVLAHAAGGAALLVSTNLVSAAQEHQDATSETEKAIHNGHIKQTICRWCYGKIPLEELCQAAVRFGFKGIDLVGPDTFPTLKKYGLVGTMTSSHTIPKGLNNKANWDECLTKIRTAIEATSDAGYPNVICFSGNRNGMDADEGMRNCCDALKQVVGLAEQKNVTICMELLNSKVDHHDYMCDHTSWGVPLVKMVASERFKLLYDIYHMQIMEGDVIRTIRQHKESFAHYHTGGVPGRHEIDESQELYYPAVIKAIVETGYKGWLGQEFIPAREPLASLAQGGRICDV
jgi:hydroxypyruvate isomerase